MAALIIPTSRRRAVGEQFADGPRERPRGQLREDVIPKGEYGAGRVIVWDCGIYAPEVNGKPCFDRPDQPAQFIFRSREP